MKKRRKNALKSLVAFGFVIFFIILYSVIFFVIKNNNKGTVCNNENLQITELNYDGNQNHYRKNITVNNDAIAVKLANGGVKYFTNKQLKYGANSFRNHEMHSVDLIINNYALINMHFASMFNTIFINLDNGDFVDNIPACKNISEKNFNKEKNTFFCANYDSTKFSENGISVFAFVGKKMQILYDEEEYLKYTDVKWISKNEIKVSYMKNKKINYYVLKCNENSCLKQE